MPDQGVRFRQARSYSADATAAASPSKARATAGCGESAFRRPDGPLAPRGSAIDTVDASSNSRPIRRCLIAGPARPGSDPVLDGPPPRFCGCLLGRGRWRRARSRRGLQRCELGKPAWAAVPWCRCCQCALRCQVARRLGLASGSVKRAGSRRAAVSCYSNCPLPPLATKHPVRRSASGRGL